jgi:uncharacterized protein YdbL (DUF1318 family)
MLLLLGLLGTGTVPAADLASAKAAGQVCERTDGYIAATSGTPADVQALVNKVNAGRRAEYERIAKKNGVSVDKVARLTAQKLIGRNPAQQCR